MLRRQGYRCLCLLLSSRGLAAALMQDGRPDQSLTQAIGVRDLLSQGAYLLAVLHGLVWIAQLPQLPDQIAARGHAEVEAVAQRQGSVLLRVIDRQCLRVVCMGRGRLAPKEQNVPQQMMGEQEERRFGLGLGQAQQLLPELVCRLRLSSLTIIHNQPPQNREKLWCVSYLLTQLLGSGVGAFHLGSSIPLGANQRGAKRHLEVQLLLQALGRLRQHRQQCQALRQVSDRFHIRRALEGSLPGSLPVAEGGLVLTRLGIVVRHQLRL